MIVGAVAAFFGLLVGGAGGFLYGRKFEQKVAATLAKAAQKLQ